MKVTRDTAGREAEIAALFRATFTASEGPTEGALIVLAVNFVASWLRVAFDPQEREKRFASNASAGAGRVTSDARIRCFSWVSISQSSRMSSNSAAARCPRGGKNRLGVVAVSVIAVLFYGY